MPHGRDNRTSLPKGPVVPRSQWAALLWAAAVASTLVVGSALSMIAISRTGGDEQAARRLLDPKQSPLVNDPSWVLAGTVASELAVGIVLLVAWRVWRRRLVQLEGRLSTWAGLDVFLPLGKPRPLAIAGAVLLVLGAAPVAEAVALGTAKLFDSDVTAGQLVVAVARTSQSGQFVLALLGLAVLPALVEEPLFRGVLYLSYARGSPVRAVAISSVFFGAFHLEPAHAAATMVLGAAFAAGRLYSGSIVTSIVAHAVYNAAVLLTVRWTPEPPGAEAGALSPLFILGGLFVAGQGFWLLRRAAGGAPLDSLPPPG